MSAAYKLVVGSLALAGWTGLGLFLWSVMAPKEDELLEMRRKATKENPAMMAELRSQNEMVLKVLKDAAETKVNVASKPHWNTK
ncbi:ubiquinol-cytochrome-c reductase complex assembly factor 3 [Ranitomeya variabilis]|uniref:ubiquinol-cytochrome-c reductase complex assembly factor 3 n=1 Tax=Ranitomeya variabilis TaxID=490064 RepID=UPI004056E322